MKRTWIISGLVTHVARSADVCSIGTISSLSKQGAIITVLSCLENATGLSFLSQSDVNNAVSDCLALVVNLAPTYAPAAATQCLSCYKGLVNDLFGLVIGTINSGVFFQTSSSLVGDCATLTTTAGIERCLKNSDLRLPLLNFQKCASYAVIYPAPGTLSIRRLFSRADIFGNLLRLALGNGAPLAGVLAQVTASSNTPATSQPILLMELCYLTFLQDLQLTKLELSLTVVRDCSSTRAGDVCLSDSRIVDALSRFTNCAGFKIDTFPVACSTDILSKIYGNYDVIASLIPQIILNFASATSAFLTSIQPVIASTTQFGTVDCALCFQELAQDIASNIQAQKARLSSDQFAAYIGGCSDPHSTECSLLIGTVALQNFQECSGSTLNLSASTTKTPTVSQASTTTSTTTPANLIEVASQATTEKSAPGRKEVMYPKTLISLIIIPIILGLRV